MIMNCFLVPAANLHIFFENSSYYEKLLHIIIIRERTLLLSLSPFECPIPYKKPLLRRRELSTLQGLRFYRNNA